jgi:hypothetical protein
LEKPELQSSTLSVASHFTDVNNTYKTCLPHSSIQHLVANTLSMEENLHITSKPIHEQWQLTGSETSSICLKKKLALATYGQVAATFKHGINPKISASRIFQLQARIRSNLWTSGKKQKQSFNFQQEPEAIFQLAARTRSSSNTGATH